ncbi:ASKHA domain-containing protein [Pseudonocardia sp. RS11V-5]|uniref:ASKHA domain-containing protein n=1 Tax=Pseudonocardia terrae TaxID=2905831 RepID=UPI001E3087D1|nr:ASKHA domain-containing protein [Pseudonocardia terrae]MCE3552717.1 ASKHA domain-containing protein [Pseudonocardia terrae]
MTALPEPPTPDRVRIRFDPDGARPREVRVPAGATLFDAASWNGIAVDSTCGGHGTCRKCRMRVVEGDVTVSRLDPRAFGPEELRAGWRLACRARAEQDLRVEVPPLVTRPKAATVGVGRQVILRPALQKRCLTLPEPTLADQRTDLERLRDALPDLELRVDLPAIRGLARALRTTDHTADHGADHTVTAVVVDDVLVDVEPGDTTGRLFGIAFDLGTTTVVATLLDLATGTPVAVASRLNPQQSHGADVITRISATMTDPTALERLTALAHQGLDQLAGEVCADGGVERHEVYEIAVAGNATMTHLALGLDPEPLGVAPFVMASRSFDDLTAADLGVRVHARARAYVFPALGAYVGGDIVAGALASGMDRDRRIRLFIDIGTNCEILLATGDRLLATAAPAGPAFEGAAIRCGMRAAPGAVEGVKISDDDVVLQVIGDVEPVGLAGSGLVDAVAAMVAAGLVDASGRLVAPDAPGVPPGLATRLRQVGQERVFVLHFRDDDPDGDPAEALYLSQRDIRELQFAKAAISTGWQLLLEEQGLTATDVTQVLLAGSFGSYLGPSAAVRIGLVPEVALLRIVSAGNVAGEGAKMALLSVRERAAAQALLEEVHYVELSDRADFNDRFVERLAFPV